MSDGRERVSVEVRSTSGRSDPADAANNAKRQRVLGLSRLAGASRIDLVGVRFDRGGIDVHWVPGVN
jgi:hypothetical protein